MGNKSKCWVLASLALLLAILAGLSAVTIYIDPYFHYHAPLESLEYPLNNERYQNDGIGKHFTYDAIITGTSMTENFMASEFDELFSANSIKVCFSGATYKELDENLRRAVSANADIRYILRGLDGAGSLIQDKDKMREEAFPTYLYDEFLLNDVSYLLNKEILQKATFPVLSYTESGQRTTSFDEYSNWMANWEGTFGKEWLDQRYSRAATKAEPRHLTDEERQLVIDNMTQNVLELVEANPSIKFYLFLPPYSIYWWDSLNQSGILERELEAERLAAELLLEHDNVELYSFHDEFDLVCNLDNYKDTLHYGEWVNTQILEWISAGEHRLTKDNYQEYYQRIYEFYTTYDYDSLFA